MNLPQSHNRPEYQPYIPPTHVPRPSQRYPNLNLSLENPNGPSVSPDNNFYVPQSQNIAPREPPFVPPVNSTYHQNSNTGRERTRRDEDNSTFRKIDALSKWRLCFNGTSVDEKHLALNDYIISIERFIKLQRLNPDDVLPYLLPTLSGNARIWYNAEGDSIVTLRDFFKGLRDNFDYKQNATDVMTAVLKQKFDFMFRDL